MDGTIGKETYPTLGVAGRVVVNGKTAVACRPALRPEGKIVEINGSGFFRVQLQDGSKHWFSKEELPPR